jgi:hypothetical protein
MDGGTTLYLYLCMLWPRGCLWHTLLHSFIRFTILMPKLSSFSGAHGEQEEEAALRSRKTRKSGKGMPNSCRLWMISSSSFRLVLISAAVGQISEAALKAADSVQVHFDGEALEKLVAKQQRKDDAGPRQPQQKKTGAAMLAVGNEVKVKKSAGVRGQKQEATEASFDSMVDLSASALQESITDLQAKHLGQVCLKRLPSQLSIQPSDTAPCLQVDTQLLALAEVWEEAFAKHSLDYTWETATAIGSAPSSWTTLPIGFVAADTQEVAAAFLSSKEVAAKDLAVFVAFLVQVPFPLRFE